MLAHAYQSGFISLLCSIGSKPLELWEKHDECARSFSVHAPPRIRRVLDEDIQSSVIQLADEDSGEDALIILRSLWIRCPPPATAASLDLRLPHVVFQLKRASADAPLTIELHVVDHHSVHRRFRLSTYQQSTVVHDLITLLPLRLDVGWNHVHCDLEKLTRLAYGSRYVHTESVQLHAHCRVRRVFFAERACAESMLPVEFRLFKRLTRLQVQQFQGREDHGDQDGVVQAEECE